MLSKPERVKNYKAMTLRLNPDAWRELRYIAHRGGRPLPAPRGFDAPGARACTHKGRRSWVLTGAPMSVHSHKRAFSAPPRQVRS